MALGRNRLELGSTVAPICVSPPVHKIRNRLVVTIIPHDDANVALEEGRNNSF